MQHQILAFFAVALAALSRTAALGFIQALETEIIERKQTSVGLEQHAATVAAIAAVRAAAGHEFFAPEGDAAVAALARAHFNARFINKTHTTILPPGRGGSRTGQPGARVSGRDRCGFFGGLRLYRGRPAGNRQTEAQTARLRNLPHRHWPMSGRGRLLKITTIVQKTNTEREEAVRPLPSIGRVKVLRGEG